MRGGSLASNAVSSLASAQTYRSMDAMFTNTMGVMRGGSFASDAVSNLVSARTYSSMNQSFRNDFVGGSRSNKMEDMRTNDMYTIFHKRGGTTVGPGFSLAAKVPPPPAAGTMTRDGMMATGANASIPPSNYKAVFGTSSQGGESYRYGGGRSSRADDCKAMQKAKKERKKTMK